MAQPMSSNPDVYHPFDIPCGSEENDTYQDRGITSADDAPTSLTEDPFLDFGFKNLTLAPTARQVAQRRIAIKKWRTHSMWKHLELQSIKAATGIVLNSEGDLQSGNASHVPAVEERRMSQGLSDQPSEQEQLPTTTTLAKHSLQLSGRVLDPLKLPRCGRVRMRGRKFVADGAMETAQNTDVRKKDLTTSPSCHAPSPIFRKHHLGRSIEVTNLDLENPWTRPTAPSYDKAPLLQDEFCEGTVESSHTSNEATDNVGQNIQVRTDDQGELQMWSPEEELFVYRPQSPGLDSSEDLTLEDDIAKRPPDGGLTGDADQGRFTNAVEGMWTWNPKEWKLGRRESHVYDIS
jgi:hypothetical protein